MLHYCRYKNEKVWNKSERLDIVFGSTGSNIGILEFMDQVDRRIQGEWKYGSKNKLLLRVQVLKVKMFLFLLCKR